MSAEFLPSLLVPIVGFLTPILIVTSFFSFINKESIN